jgi:hypothetical protein
MEGVSSRRGCVASWRGTRPGQVGPTLAYGRRVSKPVGHLCFQLKR